MPRIKVRDPRHGGVVVLDQIRQPLFDTIELTSGSTLNEIRQFFSSVQGKNSFESNLRQNNLLEQSVSFRIQGLAIDAHTVSDDDGTLSNSTFLAKIMEQSAIRLRVGEKIYWEGPMRYTTGRLSVAHDSTTTVAATTLAFHYSQYGASAVAGVILPGKASIDIPPLQSFRVEWETTGATVAVVANNNVKFVCSLKGLLRRPVQ